MHARLGLLLVLAATALLPRCQDLGEPDDPGVITGHTITETERMEVDNLTEAMQRVEALEPRIQRLKEEGVSGSLLAPEPDVLERELVVIRDHIELLREQGVWDGVLVEALSERIEELQADVVQLERGIL